MYLHDFGILALGKNLQSMSLSQGDEYVINTALKDDRETRLSVSRLTAQVRIVFSPEKLSEIKG